MTVDILTKHCCLHAHKIIVVEMFSNQGQILEEHGAMTPQTMIKNQMVPQKPNSGFAPFSDYFFSVPSYVPSSFPSCPMQVCIYASKNEFMCAFVYEALMCIRILVLNVSNSTAFHVFSKCFISFDFQVPPSLAEELRSG